MNFTPKNRCPYHQIMLVGRGTPELQTSLNNVMIAIGVYGVLDLSHIFDYLSRDCWFAKNTKECNAN